MPVLSLHDLVRAHDDVDAARHAKPDQKRDDDDVGEVERQVEPDRGGHRPQRRDAERREHEKHIGEPPPENRDDEADRDDGVGDRFREGAKDGLACAGDACRRAGRRAAPRPARSR